MKEIVVHHHLGLGDHFICNGLINKLSETSFIHLICKETNVDTVTFLYKDNNNIKVVPIKDEKLDIFYYVQKNKLELLKIGFSDFSNKTFDKSFYEQFGYDFILRYNNFKLPVNTIDSVFLYNKLAENQSDYCLISNICSEGTFDLNINNSLHKIYVVPGVTRNLLDYTMLIEYAKEIHCIDSAFYHLVDSIGVNAKLFFHDVRNDVHNKIRVSDKWIKM